MISTTQLMTQGKDLIELLVEAESQVQRGFLGDAIQTVADADSDLHRLFSALQQARREVLEAQGEPAHVVHQLKPNVSYGHLIPLEEFEQGRKHHALMSDDGPGCWATATHYADRSDVWSDNRPEWATHVLWFNK